MPHVINSSSEIGFTGTRDGMTKAQYDAVWNLLSDLKRRGARMLHHGDCVGSDAQAHTLALALSLPVTLHPPINETFRAFCKGAVAVKHPLDYLPRNRNIVDASTILVATPKAMTDLRGGTWYTIRYASRRKKPRYVVLPDGSVTLEEEWQEQRR